MFDFFQSGSSKNNIARFIMFSLSFFFSIKIVYNIQ